MSFDATPPARWRKSARCGASNGCVEVMRLDTGMICVRDGTRADEEAAGVLEFAAPEWRLFAAQARGGRFDRA
ncbi:DUF397 domain-containing protein [Actinomadura litoris]|uniref:DUF397 domain-containing protein n=2 Tax=Actinomadura TaxID=1988 RepID=A0A7K1L8E7_9ACTN|nr:DUF397 domain-containing protein [Actinomadura litoris]MBT2210436.1 DUF397 domain-containing protein [Actinomadura sp. NEAU-AAG7]MUN40573.1 DUF397 domain-containing protein [Actinomadura litoris]